MASPDRPPASSPLARTHALVVTDTSNEVLVYDVERHHIHKLNVTTAAIWRLCDGQRDLARITRDAGRALGAIVTPETVRLALTKLDDAGLLVQPLGAAVRVSRVSRRAFMQRTAVGGAVALPMIVSITAPVAAGIQSVVFVCPTNAFGPPITEDKCKPNDNVNSPPYYGRCCCDAVDESDEDCGYCGWDQGDIQTCDYDKLKCIGNEDDIKGTVPANPCPPFSAAFAARAAAVAETGTLGVVLIDRDGMPIGGAVFELYQDGTLLQTSSDPDGTGYTTFAEVPVGDVTLHLLAAPEGVTAKDAKVTIVAGENSVTITASTKGKPTDEEPTQEPTAEPTQEPTAEPTQEPTAEPTQAPEPTVDTAATEAARQAEAARIAAEEEAARQAEAARIAAEEEARRQAEEEAARIAAEEEAARQRAAEEEAARIAAEEEARRQAEKDQSVPTEESGGD